jgi:hypothetical protein
MLALLDRVLAQLDTLDLEHSIAVVDIFGSAAARFPSLIESPPSASARPVAKALSPPQGRPGQGRGDSPFSVDYLDPQNRHFPIHKNTA